MAVVLGLDPCLFLKNEEEIADGAKYSIISDLVLLVDLAQSQNIKYLYHSSFDYGLPDGIKNVMREIEDDPSFVALMLEGSFEYLQPIYGYTTEDTDGIGCSFEEPLKGFVSNIFTELFATYHHGIVISDRCLNIQIGEHIYHFVKDIINNAELSIEMLPAVMNYDDFEAYFSLYHWFYGREEYPIILSDTFVTEVQRKDYTKLISILTSLMRGIYYPDYNEPDHKYKIRAHPDSDVKTMTINQKNTTLLRIHCVENDDWRGGANRICYADTMEKDQRYIIAFHYKEDHCDKLNHEETIHTPVIIQSENAFALQNGIKFAIKVKWR